MRDSHYEHIIKELRTEVAELRAAAGAPMNTARSLELLGHDADEMEFVPQQPSSQQGLDALPAEMSDTVDSIEHALHRIADMESNCIDVNFTRVRQQRLLALGQDEAAASLSAGSSSGLIDPEFDPLCPRAAPGVAGSTRVESLAAQRECLRLLMSKFNSLVASCPAGAAVRVCQLRVELAQAAAARDVAQQSVVGISGFARDAVLDMRSVFAAGARVMAAADAKKDDSAGASAADDVLALHTRAKTVAQHYKTFARRGDHRMCSPPPSLPPPPTVPCLEPDVPLIAPPPSPPDRPLLQKFGIRSCGRQARALPSRRNIRVAAQRAPRHRPHLLSKAAQNRRQGPIHIQPCS